MKYKTYLPIFSGFYETIWQFQYDNLEYDIKEERKQKGLNSEIDFLDLNIDNKQYEYDIVENLCDVIQKELSTFVNSIELEKICSPKEYNFYNDSADVIIDVNADKIKDFIYTNKEKFTEFLKRRYTSYDGFISSYKNDFESWETDTKNFTDFNIDGHRLGSVLDFISIMLSIKEFDLYEYGKQDIYEPCYISNWDEIINKQDGTLIEFFTSKGFSLNIAEYYNRIYINGNIKEYSLSNEVLNIIKEYETFLKTV